MSVSMLRVAARSARPTSTVFRCPAVRRTTPVLSSARVCKSFSTSVVRMSGDPHGEESFEEFSARYEKEFETVQDVFELQRNLNNAFAYDLVPSTQVLTAALKAARRVNDYPTAVRIFEGIKAKVENKGQYDEYLKELEPLREELGVNLKETMYPDAAY
ncbi:COX5A-domain-containing protein [Saccharata proteae CBS 121410]|uniref:Cytochrome c oxidase subunit 6, mitochondrial n=1 Tax=Saccharata proteae CBS 121410 TaxID=1314787 RepID=A0A9P4I186_9PEZI|nr:COX5A-domain-containing protein [Saccharata proteae CBS 121410]